MNVKWLLGFLGVARSFKNEICILAPGSCIPECHAKAGCLSRNKDVGRVDFEGNSLRAIATAREAGPNPMQIRSRGAFWCDEGLVYYNLVSTNPQLQHKLKTWIEDIKKPRSLRYYWGIQRCCELVEVAPQSLLDNLQVARTHWWWHNCDFRAHKKSRGFCGGTGYKTSLDRIENLVWSTFIERKTWDRWRDRASNEDIKTKASSSRNLLASKFLFPKEIYAAR